MKLRKLHEPGHASSTLTTMGGGTGSYALRHVAVQGMGSESLQDDVHTAH